MDVKAIQTALDSIKASVDAIQSAAVVPTATPRPPTEVALEQAAINHVRWLNSQTPPPPPPPPAASGFPRFDATNYSGLPGEQLRPNWRSGTIPGTEKVAYFYEADMWPERRDPEKPRVMDGPLPKIEDIRAAWDSLIAPWPDYKKLLLDIECYTWALWADGVVPRLPSGNYDSAAGDALYRKSIDMVVSVIKMVRQVSAERNRPIEIGVYGLVPNNHWDQQTHPGAQPLLLEHAKRLPGLNDMLAPIVALVDFLSPSLYLPVARAPGEYAKYVAAVAAEAKRIAPKLPLYPHLWHLLLTGKPPGDTSLEPEMPLAEYVECLRALRACKDVDGVVIWGGYDTAANRPIAYSPSLPQIVALQAEIARG